MFKFKAYLKPQTKFMVMGPLFKFFEAAVDLIVPFMMSKIIDVGITNNDLNYIYTFAGIILGLNLLSIVFALICQKCSSMAGEGMARHLRKDMFEHINTYSHSELDRFTSAGLVNRVINDTNQMEHATSMTIRQVARSPFLLIGSTIMAMLIDLRLSLIFLIVLPIIVLIMVLITKKSVPHYAKAKVKLDNVSNITRENLEGMRVVRAFNKQGYEESRFISANKEMADINVKLGRIAAIVQPLLFIVINFSVIALIYWGGIRVNIGELSQGNVVAFISYFSQIAMALIMVARMVIIYTQTATAYHRIAEIFDVNNTINEPQNPLDYSKKAKSGAKLEFKNVNFAYPGTKNVVSNLSFTLNPGETLGIIGGTGSGKSSIVNLIPRLYDTNSGVVLIDDVDVRNYKIKDLRSIVSIVPQNPNLFEGTIESNLKWRDQNASENEIIKALKISQSYDFVKERPAFLKTKVNRGGKNFSGGQRQRLTIARAIVGNPQIIIMDDASSALDFATDANLRKELNTLKNVTKIYVSQRATSLMYADKIIVVDGGIAVDIGTHNELMSRCTLYQEIFNSQSKGGESK